MILPCGYEGAEVPNDYEGIERRLGQYNQTLKTMFSLAMDTNPAGLGESRRHECCTMYCCEGLDRLCVERLVLEPVIDTMQAV